MTTTHEIVLSTISSMLTLKTKLGLVKEIAKFFQRWELSSISNRRDLRGVLKMKILHKKTTPITYTKGREEVQESLLKKKLKFSKYRSIRRKE